MATLFIVSTPIGNLDDLSQRAADTLRHADRILAEDTRRTRILTEHIGATAPLVSLHAHNERERVAQMLGWLEAGEDLALVSDAGTPLVSDPGQRAVAAALTSGHAVVPIPGPSAPMAALVASGLPSQRFAFLGFPARKGRERERDLERIRASEETIILFESPRRLVALLEELGERCADERQVAVARELTKIHEEIVRGTLSEVAAYYRERPARGEVTVVLGPAPGPAEQDASLEDASRLARRLIEGGMRPSAAARELSQRLDLARNDAYRIVHDLEGRATDE